MVAVDGGDAAAAVVAARASSGRPPVRRVDLELEPDRHASPASSCVVDARAAVRAGASLVGGGLDRCSPACPRPALRSSTSRGCSTARVARRDPDGRGGGGSAAARRGRRVEAKVATAPPPAGGAAPGRARSATPGRGGRRGRLATRTGDESALPRSAWQLREAPSCGIPVSGAPGHAHRWFLFERRSSAPEAESAWPSAPSGPASAACWISDHFHPWNDEQGHSPFVWSVLGAIAAHPELRVGRRHLPDGPHPSRGRRPGGGDRARSCSRPLPARGRHRGGPQRAHPRRPVAAAAALEMLEEAVEVIRALWTGESTTAGLTTGGERPDLRTPAR